MPSLAHPTAADRSSAPVRYLFADTSIGTALVAARPAGVCAVLIGVEPDHLVHELQRRFPEAEAAHDDPRMEELSRRATRLVEGGHDELPLDPDGTEFELAVWAAIASIPAGSVVTYAELASRIGAPRSVRAVARACASNLIAVAIPCHRVVRSDGGLGGFRWGVARKRALLARERRPAA